MENSTIHYVIYIATTPEKLWAALTDSEALRKNWGRIQSQWTAGSRVAEVNASGKVLWSGEVLRSEPPRLFTYSFDIAGSGETPTKVTFELAPAADVPPNVRVAQLTLTQAGFEQNSRVFNGCARAWPKILSSFKSYLETGRPLGFVWKH